jgi:hypothetical protein
MTTTTTTRRRRRTPAVMAVGGTAIVVAVLFSQGPGAAAVQAGIVAGLCLLYWVVGGRDGDTAAVIGSSGDERQHLLNLRANAVSGVVTAVVALAGFTVQTARGADTGPYLLIILTAVLAYRASFEWFRRRG